MPTQISGRAATPEELQIFRSGLGVRSFLGSFTPEQIAAINAAIASGTNPVYSPGSTLINSFSGLTYTLSGIGTAAKFLSDKDSTVQSFYPYSLTTDEIPASSTLTVSLPRVVIQFPGEQVEVVAQNYTAPASSITDVWVTQAGAYVFHSVALTDYGTLPRHENYLHLLRIQTSATKIQGFYYRRSTYKIDKNSSPRRFNYDSIIDDYIIPSVYSTWSDNSVVTLGTVYRSVLGDLWKCTVAGTTAGGLASPTYSEDSNSGFAPVVSGTATFLFVGRSAYKDAWRVSPKSGIQWYFASIAAGLLASEMPDKTLAFIKSMAFHCVNNWISGVPYTEGRKVGGTLTQGRLWEATTDGTSTGTISFPANATVGQTCTDGTIVWRCLGVFAQSTQKYFWYDTDPTGRISKSPDSHDSYAACFVWVVYKYLLATNSVVWLDTSSPHNGLTYDGLIREIIYANLTTQITVNNLTKTFQNDGVPSGGTYAANFLMDNCEVWAGLKAASLIYTTYKVDAPYAASMRAFAAQIATGLEALWEPAAGAYKYVLGYPSMVSTSNEALFYPLAMSQAWPTLWGVPLNSTRKSTSFDYMSARYPKWWARNDIDDLLACGAHYGLTLSNPARLVKEDILKRVEKDRLVSGQSDFYIHDAAYYLVMRDNTRSKQLM